MKTRRLQTLATGLTVVLFAGVFAARAADFWWVDEGASGDFSTSGHWQDVDENAGVPGAADWAIFERDVAEATTVRIDGIDNRDLAGLRFGVDKVLLNLNGNNLDVGSMKFGFDAANSAVIGEMTVSGPGKLTLAELEFSSQANGGLTVTGWGTELAVTSMTGAWRHLRLDVLNQALASLPGGGGQNGFYQERVTVDNATLLIGATGTATAQIFQRDNRTGYIDVQNGGLWKSGAVLMGVIAHGFFTVNDASAHTGAVSMASRGFKPWIDIEDGGVWRVGGNLNMASRPEEVDPSPSYNRNAKAEITVSGSRESDPSVRSRLFITGNANMGKNKVFDPENPVLENFHSEEAYLNMRDGGQARVGGNLAMFFSARLTIDGGTVEATSMNVEPGKQEEIDGDTVYSNAEYVFTLNQAMVGATAPVRILKEVAIPGITAQDELGDDVIYEGTGHVTLGAGHLRLTLAIGEDEDLPGIPFAPQIGQTFNLLQYEGELTGYFLGLQPNSTVNFERDGTEYQLDYGTGTNDAITLTVIPEPHTLGLLLAAGALLALRRRRG